MSTAANPLQAKESANYGNARDWASIISQAGQGASSYLQGQAGMASTKKEAKEAKRRTLANLVNQALQRKQRMNRVQQDYQNESAYNRANSLQEIARGFVESLQGMTGHRLNQENL